MTSQLHCFRFTFISFVLIASVNLVSCKKGCTDPSANNYDASAKKEDESCNYDEIEDTDNDSITYHLSIGSNPGYYLEIEGQTFTADFYDSTQYTYKWKASYNTDMNEKDHQVFYKDSLQNVVAFIERGTLMNTSFGITNSIRFDSICSIDNVITNSSTDFYHCSLNLNNYAISVEQSGIDYEVTAIENTQFGIFRKAKIHMQIFGNCQRLTPYAQNIPFTGEIVFELTNTM